MDTGTSNGGHNTPETSETKVDTTTNSTKTLKEISNCHIKGNKSNACFNTPILNQNIITTLPISHPNKLSPIPTKLHNLCYPSKPHKLLIFPYQNKI